MIAPVAAPHAAPWPTGVSHEMRARQTRPIAEVTARIFVPIVQFSLRIKLRSPPDVAGTPSRQPLSARTGATDIQIRALRARPRLARHARLLSSSHTVDMAGIGSFKRPEEYVV